MTSTKRVQRLAVAGAVVAAGAFVAGPAASSAAPAERLSSEQASSDTAISATKSTTVSYTARVKKYKCHLKVTMNPRVGKGNKHIRSRSRAWCGTKKHPGPKMPKIWTSVQLKQTKAHNKYKLTDKKNTRHNKATVTTFCPREFRSYTVVGHATVKLPKDAKKKQLKLRPDKGPLHQAGRCR